jgi:hypothetical protein
MHKDMFVQMTQPQGPPMGPPPGPGGPPPNAPKPPQPNAGVQMNEGQNAPTIQ